MSLASKLLKFMENYVDDYKNGAGILFRYQNEVFLIKRSNKVDNPGLWSVPGGYARIGEDLFDAAIREAREELSNLPGYLYTGKKAEVYNNDMLYTTFLVDSDRKFDEITLNWEAEDYGWFSVSSLDKMSDSLHPGFKKSLNVLLKT